MLRILTPTESPETNSPAVESAVVPAEPGPARAARLTPGEGRGHKGAMDVVKTLGLDPALVKALDAVEVEEEEEDESVDANKTRAARARIAERVRARRIAGRVAYRAGARAARDAVLKTFGASSAAMAAVDAAFSQNAGDDDDLLEGGEDPLTEEERAVAGRDGYREGLKTANAALATAYRVADVVTRGEKSPRASAALGSFAFSDASEGVRQRYDRGALGASGRERDAKKNDARVGDGREERGERRRAVYAGWAAALAGRRPPPPRALAAAPRGRRGTKKRARGSWLTRRDGDHPRASGTARPWCERGSGRVTRSSMYVRVASRAASSAEKRDERKKKERLDAIRNRRRDLPKSIQSEAVKTASHRVTSG